MRVSNIPKLVGNMQRRTVEIREEGGEKYLHLGVSRPTLVEGEMRILRLVWKRMGDNAGARVPARL